MSAKTRREGRRRAHQATCERKITFQSQMLADNFATLVAWACPDDPQCQGMEGYRCLVCTSWHVGHHNRASVIPFGYDTGRDPRSEANSDAPAHSADALGGSDIGWVPTQARIVQESTRRDRRAGDRVGRE